MIDRPAVVTDEHLNYLDDLRESGDTNMFGAKPYLMGAFPELDKQDTCVVLSYWMASFGERDGAEAAAADRLDDLGKEAGRDS